MIADSGVLQKSHDLLSYGMGLVSKFPRDQRFLLGDRIQKILLDVQLDTIAAYYETKAQKKSILKTINIKLEQLRWLFRLSFEKRFLTFKKQLFVVSEIDVMGRMIGGWLKSLK